MRGERLSERPISRQDPDFKIAVAFLGSGVALVIAILCGTILAVTLPLCGMFVAIIFFRKYLRSTSVQRKEVQNRLRVGLFTGTLATVAYDVWRIGLVKSLGLSFAPLGALPHFGHLLIGAGASEQAAWIAGGIYHYLNGVTFSIAYCFALGGRNWKWGVAWAMGLELAMFMVYPGWLHLSGLMEEFTLISLTGHVAYGIVLGVVSERYLSN